MFVSENIYKNDLNLFNYQNHICYIKDLINICVEIIDITINHISVQDVEFIYIRRKFI